MAFPAPHTVYVQSEDYLNGISPWWISLEGSWLAERIIIVLSGCLQPLIGLVGARNAISFAVRRMSRDFEALRFHYFCVLVALDVIVWWVTGGRKFVSSRSKLWQSSLRLSIHYDLKDVQE